MHFYIFTEVFYNIKTNRNLYNIIYNLTTTIRAKSVGPLRRIYPWFSPLSIFNVIHTILLERDSTVEYIETNGGKGDFYLETRIWD